MIALEHIHPMIVHFPIVFFLTLAAVDIVALIRGSTITTRSAWGCVSTSLAVLAGASAIVAWIFGGIALDTAEAGGFSSDIAETHEGLGTTTAIAFAIWALVRIYAWWRNRAEGAGIRAGIAVVEIAGAILVIATAYYGGTLVYGLGVNVAKAATGG